MNLKLKSGGDPTSPANYYIEHGGEVLNNIKIDDIKVLGGGNYDLYARISIRKDKPGNKKDCQKKVEKDEKHKR